MTKGHTNYANQVPFWTQDTLRSVDTANTTANSVNSHGVTIFGIPPATVATKRGGSGKKVANPGWVRQQKGTGPVVSFTPSVAGTGYVNGNIVTVTGGVSPANGTITTNGAGAVVSIAIINGGKFQTSTGTTVAVANSTGGATGVGSGATITFTLGGRAGRVTSEVLVAMKTMTANGTGGEFTNLS